jgi:HK97 gp10 family phage protein
MATRSQSLKVEGIKELREMLKGIAPKEANNAMRAATFAIANEVVLPGLQRRVKEATGDLKKSLFAIRRRGRPGEHISEVRGGSTAPYMLMLEFGTSKTRAQPFIVPATEEIRPKQAELYRELFFEKLRKTLEREAKTRAKR